MKILFIYTKFDNALKLKVEELRAHNAEVSTLSLLEYKLQDKENVSVFNPPSRLEFLEDKSPKLRLLNRIFKRKKLIQNLDDYDIIDIYKCEKSALFIVDEVSEKCYDFFVTCSKEQEKNVLFSRFFYKYLYEKARFLLFNNKRLLKHFPYPDEEKSCLIYDGIPLLDYIDAISEEEVFKASHAMGFDLEKDIIYCDMSGSTQRQITFIDTLLTLPKQRLKESTFIFHLNQHTLDERKHIRAHMEEKNFDYILIEAFITPKQSALLYKIADKAIVLSYTEENATLVHALYAKNHTYLYHDTAIDAIFKERDIFIDSFENFMANEGEGNLIIKDMLQANKEKIYEVFSVQESINHYIEVLKSV